MMRVRRRLMMAPKSKLPSGYIPLEYIESTGNQCINTGVKPTSETVCRIKVNMTRINAKTTVGYSSGIESDSFRFFNANGLIYLDYGSGTQGGNRIYFSFILLSDKINQSIFFHFRQTSIHGSRS